MAGKKNAKSSKTEHVLSLLSGAAPQGAPAENAAPSAPAGAAAPVRSQAPSPAVSSVRPLTPPILEVARTNNEALSQTIRDALEQTFQEEQAAEAGPEDAPASPGREAAPPPSPDSSPSPVSPSASVPPPPEDSQPEGAAAAVEAPPEGSQPGGAAAAAEAPPPSRPDAPPAPAGRRPGAPPSAEEPAALPDGAVPLNVMELLVEEKLTRYVRMFHLCDCPRCLADTKALSLTRLPPKYVVLSASARNPMMGLYRSRYDAEVTTQIIYACKAVMEAPRHSLPSPDPQAG